jgi:uncharacterized C2H2 Zn-finger protein
MQRRHFVMGALGLLGCACSRDREAPKPTAARAASPASDASGSASTKAAAAPKASATAVADDELHGCGELDDDADAVLTAGQPMPGFPGCDHEAIEVPAAQIVRQPGAKRRDATHCPVCGKLFRVASGPRTPLSDGELFFCCKACAQHFGRHRDAVMKQRGLS